MTSVLLTACGKILAPRRVARRQQQHEREQAKQYQDRNDPGAPLHSTPLLLKSERVRRTALWSTLAAHRTADCINRYLESLAARLRVGEGETAPSASSPPSPSGGAVSTSSPTKLFHPDRRGKRAI